MTDFAKLAVSLLPVLAFLGLLRLLDSYKLLTLRGTLRNIAAGCAVAAVCYGINTIALQAIRQPAGQRVYVNFGAPVVEEVLKSAYLVWLIRNHRVGFMVDSAISGFAIGTGFAVVENIAYVSLFDSGNPMLWILRGFSTAVMHGGTSAMAGIIASSLGERRGVRDAKIFVPGLALAIVIHSVYNQGLVHPLVTAVCVLVGLPLVLALVFLQSEKGLRQWLGDRLDKDVDLLHMIATGQLAQTHAGRYLRSLKTSFPPEIVGDMLCMLQLSLELGAQAKGDLLMREAGFDTPPDSTLPARFKELAFLERSIGAAGRLAMAPLITRSARDLWQLQLLK